MSKGAKSKSKHCCSMSPPSSSKDPRFFLLASYRLGRVGFPNMSVVSLQSLIRWDFPHRKHDPLGKRWVGPFGLVLAGPEAALNLPLDFRSRRNNSPSSPSSTIGGGGIPSESKECIPEDCPITFSHLAMLSKTYAFSSSYVFPYAWSSTIFSIGLGRRLSRLYFLEVSVRIGIPVAI